MALFPFAFPLRSRPLCVPSFAFPANRLYPSFLLGRQVCPSRLASLLSRHDLRLHIPEPGKPWSQAKVPGQADRQADLRTFELGPASWKHALTLERCPHQEPPGRNRPVEFTL